MGLVSIQDVNDALRLDLASDGASPPTFTDDRIPEVELKLGQAEDIVLDYLKVAADKWDESTVPARVKTAVLLSFEALFDNRYDLIAALKENNQESPIVAVLWRLRDPALA